MKKPEKKKRIFSTHLGRIFIPAFLGLFLYMKFSDMFLDVEIFGSPAMGAFLILTWCALTYMFCYDWFESLFYPKPSSKKPFTGDVDAYFADLKEKPWWVSFRQWNALDKENGGKYWEEYSGLHKTVVAEVKAKYITPETGRDILVDMISFSDAADARQNARKEKWRQEDAAKEAKRKPARKKPAKKVAKKPAKKAVKKVAKKAARKEKA